MLLQTRVGKIQRHHFGDNETDSDANVSVVLTQANSSDVVVDVAVAQVDEAVDSNSSGMANLSENTRFTVNSSTNSSSVFEEGNSSEGNVFEVAAPLKSNVSMGDATTQANKSADLLEVAISEVRPITGSNAVLTEVGYHSVAALKNGTEMETFVLRVVADMDFTVASTGWRALRGFVPFYSGEKAVRSVKAMKEEMHRIAAIPHAWLSRRGGCAPLNEVGFDAVVSLQNNTEMERFIKRMAGDYLDMTVLSEKGLKEFAPYYSGAKAKKKFDVLLDELRKVAKSKSSWLIDRHEDLMHSGEECLSHCRKAGFCNWCGVGNACCRNGGGNPDECRASVTDYHTTDYECLEIATGASAPLDQRGYAAVVELKNNTMMLRFVRRVAEHLDMTVKSEMSMLGLIPWYSGIKGKKSLKGLEAELRRVSALPNGWLAPRGKTAPLSNQGYNAVAALGSNLEMAEFARRVAEDQHLEVKSERGLKGLVPYYSGDRTRHDFDTLAAELKHLSEKPDNWIIPGP